MAPIQRRNTRSSPDRSKAFVAIGAVCGILVLTQGEGVKEALFESEPTPWRVDVGQEAQVVVLGDASNYQRALEESLGFFDDIPEHKWLRRKTLTKQNIHVFTPIIKDNAATWPNKTVAAAWYSKNWHPDFWCDFEDFIGPGGDGGKWVCDPHRINKKGCLVYSIGSNGKFDFEASVQSLLPECEIHIFDFRDYTVKMNRDYGINASFHAWGIQSNDGQVNEHAKFKRGRKRNNMKSLRETAQELGHVGRFIDIFKIDCEGCEWLTFRDWFDDPGISGIRQIQVETHGAPPESVNDFFEFLHEEQGYVMFHQEANIEFGKGTCVEFSFLKMNKTYFT